MPKNKFQDVIFTLIMVVVMVYAMVIYNISLDTGKLTNQVFLMAFGELPIMGIVAFFLEQFIVLSVWIQTAALNFPMALCWQIFFAGPLVRGIFRRLFPEKEPEAQIS